MAYFTVLHWLNAFQPNWQRWHRHNVMSSSQTLGIGVALLMLVVLVGCAQPLSTPASTGLVQRSETVVLPTEVPTTAPSPISTRVMPLQTFTAVPTSPLTPTITAIPAEVRGLVVETIDGDSIAVVLQGDPPSRIYQVNYLGIEAPANSPDSPWGKVAYETNRKLANLKVVRLVQDQTNVDEEGHLWRYVYVGDQLLSIILVEQGLARANVVEPDTRFKAEIEEAEARAKAGRLGLWSNQPPTPTPQRTQPIATAEETTPAPASPSPRITVTITSTTVTTATGTVPAATSEPGGPAIENDTPTAVGTAEN